MPSFSAIVAALVKKPADAKFAEEGSKNCERHKKRDVPCVAFIPRQLALYSSDDPGELCLGLGDDVVGLGDALDVAEGQQTFLFVSGGGGGGGGLEGGDDVGDGLIAAEHFFRRGECLAFGLDDLIQLRGLMPWVGGDQHDFFNVSEGSLWESARHVFVSRREALKNYYGSNSNHQSGKLFR
jgi:hypothetical protein